MAAETSSQASRIGPPSPTQNFASGKLDSIPSAADGLSAFFRLKPVPYVAGENASKSKSTRPPKFFDLHLYEPLQLKTVVVSEELTQRFSSICDQKIRALDAKIVHRPASAPAVFPELTDMKASSEEIVQDINSEASIVEDYSRRTGEACLKVASKLLFGLENNGNLRWEKTDRTAEQALPDVYLTLGDKEISLCQEQIKSFDSIRKHLLHRLTLVEFKSLVAGDLEVMTEIVNLAGKFTWMTCGSTDHGRMHNCGVKKHATGNVSSVTGRKTGYDATQAWWTKTSPVLLRKRRNDPFPELDPEQVEETSTKASVYTTTVASCESPGNIMAHEGVELDSMLPIKQEQPLVPPQAHGDFASCSKPESDPNSNGNQDEDEPHSACDILQQVWAALVWADVTFGVISSGNYEIFVRRHRESQTLYISPVINPSVEENPTHYKLHTGLCIISYLDAENRAMQLDDMFQIPEDQWLPRYVHSYDRDSFKYVMPRQKRVKKEVMKNIQRIDQQLLGKLKTASRISLRFHTGDLADHEFHYFRRKKISSVFQTPPESTPEDQLVSMETEPPNGIDNTDVEDNNIVMFDTDDEDFSDSEMPNRDQTSTEGNLEIDIKRKLEGNHAYCGIVSQAEGFTTIRYSGELILKLATTRDRRTSLRNEFAAYAQLAREKNPFIVEAYGLFTSRLHRSSKTAYEVLILADGGTSLDSRMKLSIYQETKDRIRNAVNEALTKFHDERNFHNDLTSAHILLREVKHSKTIQIRFVSLSGFLHVEIENDAEDDPEHKTSRRIQRRKNDDRGVLNTIDNSWRIKASRSK